MYALVAFAAATPTDSSRSSGLTHYGSYTPEQGERLRAIHDRLIQARRELDALIGDAYLRPRASIVPVHFLDLASAVEKLRWAEKEWRELDRELAAAQASSPDDGEEEDEDEEGLESEPHLLEAAHSDR